MPPADLSGPLSGYLLLRAWSQALTFTNHQEGKYILDGIVAFYVPMPRYIDILNTCYYSANLSSYSVSTTMSKCRRVFQSVVHLAVQELCKAANSIVLPVTLGVAKPTNAFSLMMGTNIDVSALISMLCLFIAVYIDKSLCLLLVVTGQ